MKMQTVTYRMYRELEDKTQVELAVVTLNAAQVRVVERSQYMDLRAENGETFATLTFPSWVKVRKIGE